MMGRLLAAALLTMLVCGCAKPPTSDEQLAAVQAESVNLANSLRGQVQREQSAVVIRLAFGPEADLDLYVTDPLLDTVYFARHESRTGGVISDDVRCDSVGPRVEEVRFANLWPGRYRVGIDFPRRCDGERAPAPAAYAISVNANGAIYSANGVVDLQYFEVVVLEFDVEEGES